MFAGKNVRLGVHMGRRPMWKRATVKLRAGDRIEIFEEV
jgi:ribosomal protein L23